MKIETVTKTVTTIELSSEERRTLDDEFSVVNDVLKLEGRFPLLYEIWYAL